MERKSTSIFKGFTDVFSKKADTMREKCIRSQSIRIIAPIIGMKEYIFIVYPLNTTEGKKSMLAIKIPMIRRDIKSVISIKNTTPFGHFINAQEIIHPHDKNVNINNIYLLAKFEKMC